MGRRTKCTPELQEKMIKLLAEGNYVRHACAQVGIDEKTYQVWRAKGEQGKAPYKEFILACKRAQAESIGRNVKIVQVAGAPHPVRITKTIERRLKSGTVITETTVTETTEFDWRAAAWYLERSCPREWGPQQRIELSSNDEPILIKRGMKGPPE